jgi:CBS domain containing-hemolysin-like protein
MIVLITVGLIGSAFFSGAEIALLSCNRLRLHHLAREGSRPARRVLALLDRLQEMITTILLGTNLCNVMAASTATVLFTLVLPGNEALVSTLVVTPLILMFGEIYPKTVFHHWADPLSLVIAPALRVFRLLFLPFVRLADGAVTILLRIVGAAGDAPGTVLTRDELQHLMGEGREVGVLRSDGWQMIRRTFHFSATTVESIMVPLVEVFALEEHALIGEVLPHIMDRGHSRIPVYRERIDNIVGLIYVFDLLGVGSQTPVSELMVPAYYVPESKKLQQLIREMKESRVHQAVVVDEYGGATGIVTLEDTLERIVGEIRDEFDAAADPLPEPGGGWITLSARTPLARVQRSLGTRFATGESKTIGGYVVAELGRIPAAGELCQIGEWEFEVLEATPRAIRLLRLRRRV